jgi:hypothetical protein
MKTIDKKWLKKIQDHIDTLNRSVKNTENRCEKSIFVDRYFSFLLNRAFKLKIKDEVFYAFFTKGKVTTDNKHVSYNYGISYYLGYGSSEYEISFFDEKANVKKFVLHYNDILRIKFEEISLEEYYKIVNLFSNE